ncbi:MAG: MAPEG family protein [Pseudomonadota bacterium]
MQSSHALIFPMFVHVAWTFLLYGALTVARAPVVWKFGLSVDGKNPFADIEPRVSANLRNQFEWPLFFHIVCLLLIVNPTWFTPVHVALAWVFITGRLLHSLVQVFTANVRARGLVFTINFLAVLAMWILVVFGR